MGTLIHPRPFRVNKLISSQPWVGISLIRTDLQSTGTSVPTGMQVGTMSSGSGRDKLLVRDFLDGRSASSAVWARMDKRWAAWNIGVCKRIRLCPHERVLSKARTRIERGPSAARARARRRFADVVRPQKNEGFLAFIERAPSRDRTRRWNDIVLIVARVALRVLNPERTSVVVQVMRRRCKQITFLLRPMLLSIV